MPRTIQAYDVFLASPSDVNDERLQVRHAIDHFNNREGIQKGQILNLISWETTMAAGIGEDAQAVINEQVPPNYDILIAIFWHRLGSPTKRDISGSVEELKRGITLNKQQDKFPKILVLFKDDPIPPSQLDVRQYESLMNFKKELEDLGVFYQYFSADKFRDVIDLNIVQAVAGISGENSTQIVTIDKPKNNVSGETQEEGIIELQEQLGEIMEQISEFLMDLTEKTETMSSEMNEQTSFLSERAATLSSRDIKGATSKVAEAMDLSSFFIEENEDLLTDLGINFSAKVEALVDTLGDFDQIDADLIPSMVGFRESVGSSNNSMTDMRSSLVALPRMTTTLNKAKRRYVENLDVVSRLFESLSDTADRSLPKLTELT